MLSGIYSKFDLLFVLAKMLSGIYSKFDILFVLARMLSNLYSLINNVYLIRVADRLYTKVESRKGHNQSYENNCRQTNYRPFHDLGRQVVSSSKTVYNNDTMNKYLKSSR